MTVTGGGPALHGADAVGPADRAQVTGRSRATWLRTVLALARVEASVLLRSVLVLAGLLRRRRRGLGVLRAGATVVVEQHLADRVRAAHPRPGRPGRRAAGRRAGPARRHAGPVRQLPGHGRHPHRGPPGRPGWRGARQPAADRRRRRAGAGPWGHRRPGHHGAGGRAGAGDRCGSSRDRDRHAIRASAGRSARRIGAAPQLRDVSPGIGCGHLASPVGVGAGSAELAAQPAGRIPARRRAPAGTGRHRRPGRDSGADGDRLPRPGQERAGGGRHPGSGGNLLRRDPATAAHPHRRAEPPGHPDHRPGLRATLRHRRRHPLLPLPRLRPRPASSRSAGQRGARPPARPARPAADGPASPIT